MRVLITTQPGTGHLFPLLPLARALRAAGHEVAFACAPSFARAITSAGFEVLPAGLDWLESEPELAFPEMAAMTVEEKDAMITEIFTDISANHMTHDLLELCPTWRPDVLVRDYSEYGACLAGEVLGIPHATVGLGLYVPDYITGLVMEKPLAYLRSAYGLSPQNPMAMLDPYLYLTCLPPTLQFPEYTLPAVMHSLRPTDPYAGQPVEPPAWLATLPDQPTIYASMGTVFNRVPEIFRAILEGLREEPVNLIMTIGRNQDPAQFGPVPDNIRIEQFVPQHALMPHCDAVITHGGINTVVTALSYGLPTLLVPLVGHQWQNVTRCLALGVGRALHLPHAGPESVAAALYGETTPLLSAPAVRDAVRALLHEPRYRDGARAIQREIEALPGPEAGVALLERLAVERAPIVNGAIAV